MSVRCNMECESCEIIQEIKQPWGRLSPCLPNLEKIDLFGPIITFGKSENCDVVITPFATASKEHFCITKDANCTVYITDFSKNGTFINAQRINKGKRNLMHSGDIIAIGHKFHQAYIFKLVVDCNDENNDLPEELQKKYVLGALVKRGTHKEVSLGFEKITSKTHIIKKLIKSKKLGGNQSEIDALKSLSHPCLIDIKEMVECDIEIFVVLEYIRSGNLATQIETGLGLNEFESKFIFYQISLALQYLHKNGIIHANLKPENVFLQGDYSHPITVKITDFGLTKIMDNVGFTGNFLELPNFVAPELLDAHCLKYDEKVDVWSLGEILYYMLFKSVPFKGLERRVVIGSNSIYRCDDWDFVSNHVRDLVQRMLTINPETRITIEDTFKHLWIEKDDELKVKVNQWIRSSHGSARFELKSSKRARLEVFV